MSVHHIAAMLFPAWGHTISYIHLALQMLNQDPHLVITLFQHNNLVAQMEAELQTSKYEVDRLRIIGVGDKDLIFSPSQVQVVFGEIIGGWMQTVPKLAEGSEGWPKPHTIHMDVFGGGFVIEDTKQIFGPGCKTLLWFSSAVASMAGLLTEYDIAAITEQIFANEVQRQGRSKEEILNAVAIAWNGTDKTSGMVIKIPGGPDLYDYECCASGSGVPEGMGMLFSGCQKFAKATDGFIVPTTMCIEPVGVPYWKELCTARGQEFFPVGLQTHDTCWADDDINNGAEIQSSVTNATIKAFLHGAVSQFGRKSVLYISFGSLFFPTATPEHILALVDTLLELPSPFPFLFALGGKLASLPTEVIERVNTSGRGLVCNFWVEQRAILQSGAVGWFLTHGGFNSATESLSQGIPLIIWPTNAEQPINAALLSQEPKPVAIELLQVRTGRQLGPSLRGGPEITGTVADAVLEFKEVFRKVREERGQMIAANAVKLATALREARKGEAAAEIQRLCVF